MTSPARCRQCGLVLPNPSATLCPQCGLVLNAPSVTANPKGAPAPGRLHTVRIVKTGAPGGVAIINEADYNPGIDTLAP